MAASSGDRLDGLLVTQHDDTKNYKFLRISSQERNSGEPYNFNVNFGNDLNLDHVTEVHLVSASIPNVFPNISAAKGNNLFLATGSIAGVISFAIPDGFWSTSTLSAYLTTEINTIIAPSTITVVQNAISQKLVYTITGAETISFLSEASGNLLAEYIGTLVDTAPTALYTANTPLVLMGETVFYIHSQELASNSTYLATPGNIIDVNGFCTIPVTVNFGQMQNYQPAEGLDRQVFGRFGKSTRSVSITLRGNRGRLLTELTDNYEMVIVLKLMY